MFNFKYIMAWAAASAAALGMAACAPPHKKTEKFHVEKHRVLHFADGRVGYHDDNMVWYWLIMNNQGQTSTSLSTPTIAGGWQRGNPPSQEEIDKADVQDQGVIENDANEPVDAAEAEAVEAANPSVADTAPDAVSGDISATVEFSAAAEGTVDAGTDGGSTDTGSVDAGSTDGGFSDGGGGDAGGGGE